MPKLTIMDVLMHIHRFDNYIMIFDRVDDYRSGLMKAKNITLKQIHHWMYKRNVESFSPTRRGDKDVLFIVLRGD